VDFPLLKNALVNGEVSVNKLARIASIVTKENERDLFEKVMILSQPALEIFVRDVRESAGEEDTVGGGVFGFEWAGVGGCGVLGGIGISRDQPGDGEDGNGRDDAQQNQLAQIRAQAHGRTPN
jgi:hypothetical protein